MNLKHSVSTFIDEFKRHTKDKLIPFLVINALIIAAQTVYINLRIQYVNSQIPFWYTKPWGDYQLGDKYNLYYIPVLSLALLIGGMVLFVLLNRYFIRYLASVFGYVLTISNLVLFYSVYRIISVASVPFDPLINPRYVEMFLPFVAGFGVIYYLMPLFIDFAFDKNIVTNPGIHAHPGMALAKPSARGGGVVYALAFMILSVVFVGFNPNLLGFYLSLIMLSALAVVDDIQNTNIRSTFAIFEKPALRLGLLFASVLPVVLSNIRIEFVSNPFGGILFFDSLNISIGGTSIPMISAVVTIIWIVWIMNLLSWSNGIDGQFSGIIFVASLITALLALRFDPLQEIQRQVAILAVLSAGISFGFIKFTWNPSKIMWGFGAVSAGLTLSVLSILIQGKVVTSIMIILIPFLDAVVTIVRRLIQKRNPLRGDRGHLHHLLLERGWTPKRIAVFYWLATLLFGVIGLLTAEKNTVIVTLIVAGFVGFFIILLNVLSVKGKRQQQLAE